MTESEKLEALVTHIRAGVLGNPTWGEMPVLVLNQGGAAPVTYSLDDIAAIAEGAAGALRDYERRECEEEFRLSLAEATHEEATAGLRRDLAEATTTAAALRDRIAALEAALRSRGIEVPE